MYVVKTEALISCAFIFAYMQKSGFLMTRLRSQSQVTFDDDIGDKQKR